MTDAVPTRSHHHPAIDMVAVSLERGMVTGGVSFRARPQLDVFFEQMEQWRLPVSIITAMPYNMAESIIETLADRSLVPVWVAQAVPILSCRDGYPSLVALAPEGRGLLIDTVPPAADISDLAGWVPVPELAHDAAGDDPLRYIGIPVDFIEERAFPLAAKERDPAAIRRSVVRRAARARLGQAGFFWPGLPQDALGDLTPVSCAAQSDRALDEVLTALFKERVYR